MLVSRKQIPTWIPTKKNPAGGPTALTFLICQLQLRSAFDLLASVTSRAVVANAPTFQVIKIREIRGRCHPANVAAAPHQQLQRPKEKAAGMTGAVEATFNPLPCLSS